MQSEIVTAYIGLGSNLGDRAGNLLFAVRGLIEASFAVVKLSAVYETEPVEIETDLRFLNMVAEIKSEGVTPSQMMARLLRIEYLLGRTDKSLKNLERSTSTFFSLAAKRRTLLFLLFRTRVPTCEILYSYQWPRSRRTMFIRSFTKI